jgi:hypothetical protein
VSKLIDLTGQDFGHWRVLWRSLGNDNCGKPLWVCLCTLCNERFEVSGKSLRSGRSSSCRPCRNSVRFIGNKHPHWKGYRDIPQAFWRSVEVSARERKIDFEISIEDAWRLLEQQNFKCALTGLDINIKHIQSHRKQDCTASLDRIDSSKGYTLNNIQWVHKAINKMKMDLCEDEFINLCSLVAERNYVQAV